MMRLWRWLSENSNTWDRWTGEAPLGGPEHDPSLYDDLWGPYSLGIYDGVDWEAEEEEEEVA